KPHGQSGYQSLECEAGFITIEPVDFYFHYQSYFSRLTLRSSEARIWYSFQPADQDPGEKPLFIFFNGGPGGATSDGLMSLNTARMTLDTTLENGGDEFIPNPVSWSRMGNLLYVDARLTGFSYNLMNSPGDGNARFREFNAQNFNIFFDAADFIRLLLEFLSDHPELQDNPVIIVGESYGGVRSTVMLHILLNYKDYANGIEMYQDDDLVEKIQAHYDAVFPGYNNQTVPPEIIARQFSHQILIQPAISAGYQHQVAGEMFEQEGSVIFQVAREEGLQYVPCWQKPSDSNCNPRDNALIFIDQVARRDYYNYTKPKDWLWDIFFNAARLLSFTNNLMMVTGVDVTGIPLLYASARTNAYKLNQDLNVDTQMDKHASFEQLIFRDMARKAAKLAAEEPGDMRWVFGALQPWDRYFLSLNYDANSAFHWNIALYRGYDVDYYSPRCGRMFLKNVAHVNTFITNGAYDLVVYSRAIPGSLALHYDILESVIHDAGEPGSEDRPGRIILNYNPDAFPGINDLYTRTIKFPLYAFSSHAVSINQPQELFADVLAWLTDTGLSLNEEEK
ncbi:MAG: hypothetical protein JSV88_14590, partial [Candidatus Aminicenantes bacterium]